MDWRKGAPTGPLSLRAPAAHHPPALVLGPQPGLRARTGVVEASLRGEVIPERPLGQRQREQPRSAWARASETQLARARRDGKTTGSVMRQLPFESLGARAGGGTSFDVEAFISVPVQPTSR